MMFSNSKEKNEIDWSNLVKRCARLGYQEYEIADMFGMSMATIRAYLRRKTN